MEEVLIQILLFWDLMLPLRGVFSHANYTAIYDET